MNYTGIEDISQYIQLIVVIFDSALDYCYYSGKIVREIYMYGLKRYGTTALVTGASTGIGREFARVLAEEGLHLIVVARRELLLNDLKDELEEKYAVPVHVVAMDLTEAGATERLFREVRSLGIDVDILVNNAGFGLHHEFVKGDREKERVMVDLNCQVPVTLTHLFLPGMIEKGRGAIVNLSSLVGIMPIPNMATYSATKAFIRYLTNSLYGELKGTGVDIIAVLPGDTDTEFRKVSGLNNKFPTPARTAEDVVKTTFSNIGRKPSVVDGKINKLSVLISAITPLKILLKINAHLWTTD